ncbi:MAG: glycosyltransferase [Caldilineaceae bacterium]
MTQPLHITFMHYASPPVVGGVESVLAHQANAAATAGHAVSILTGRGEAWRNDIPVVRVPLADSIHPAILAIKPQLDQGLISGTFNDLVAQIERELTSALRALGTQVLIAHNVASLAKSLPLTAALYSLSQKPGSPGLVLWHHDLAWGPARDQKGLHDADPWNLLRRDWPWAQQVVISQARHDELVALGIPATRIHLVPNGVDQAGLLKLEPQTLAIADVLGLWEADPLLLLPARITRRKNIEFALHVMAHLRTLRLNPHLVVTGPTGPHNPANQSYFDYLLVQRAELGLEGAVHFLAEKVGGTIPDPVVADLYRMASALFLPSLEEGFGIPLLEAAMTRLPIFCSDIPPLRELGSSDVTYFALDAHPALVARQIDQTLASMAPARFQPRARQYSWRRLWREAIEPIVYAAAQTAAHREGVAVGTRDAGGSGAPSVPSALAAVPVRGVPESG